MKRIIDLSTLVVLIAVGLGTARLPRAMNVQTVSGHTVVGLTTDIDGFVNVDILHSTACPTC